MSKRQPRAPRTMLHRLLDILTARRAEFIAYKPPGRWPDARQAILFERYSLAVRELVSWHLSAPLWRVEPETWAWDGHVHEFTFEYGGPVDREAQPVVWARVRLQVDPDREIDAELSRIAEVADRCRQSVGGADRHEETEVRRQVDPGEGAES